MSKNQSINREDLVTSFSRHAKLSSYYMVAILLIAIIYVMNISPSEKITMPIIGEIDVKYFHLVSILILACLIILFSSVHLMAMRIREYYNAQYQDPNDKDYIDLIVEPTIFRMAPISWMIKNKNIFYSNITEANLSWKRIELIVYLILKIIVFIITFIFPVIVQILIIINSGIFNFSVHMNALLRIFFICLLVTSFISFAIVWRNEIYLIFKMFSNIKIQKKNFTNKTN